MKKLDGKVAVVTGASKGIGAGIAIELAAHGAAVVVNYVNSQEDAERVVGRIVDRGGKAIAIKANVADSQDVNHLMNEASDAFGPLDFFNGSGGSIVNIGSGVTRLLSPGSALYAGSKGALELASIVMAKELGARNIRVNVVSPGATNTEGAHAVGAMSDAVQQHYVTQTPLGRVGLPRDIAKIVAFLASDDSSWITGENIHASGGLR